jgi:hypothetical protein
MIRFSARAVATARQGFGFTLVLAALSGVAHASVPELDPGSMSSGLALLCGGLFLISGRRARK